MLSLVVVVPLLLAAAAAQHADVDDDEELRCLLAASRDECPLIAPPAAAALLRAAPAELRQALATEGLRWSEGEATRALSPALVPLLPLRHLLALPSEAAAELLSRRPDAAGLATALVTAVTADPKKRRDFMERLYGAALGYRTEELLGAWAAQTASDDDAAYDELALLRRAGSGLLAVLPAARLLEMPDDKASSYLFVLRSWRNMTGAEHAAAWRRAPALSRRAWAKLALRTDHLPRAGDASGPKWTPDLLLNNGFLLDGSVEGEVAPLPAEAASWAALGALSSPPLTARALLDDLTAHAALPPLNVSLLLAPAALARLRPGAAVRAAWAPALLPGGGARRVAALAPLGSARAAALLLSDGAAPNDAGALAWALPPALRALLRAPWPAALAALDSPRFTRLEAHRLLEEARGAQNSSAAIATWLQARGLLRGLRAGTLLPVLRPERLPQPLLLHLLRAFPGDAPAPLALSLLARVRRHLGSEPLLEAALRGAGAGALLGQLTPAELRVAGRALARLLPGAGAAALHALPDRVLWAALEAHIGGGAATPSVDAWTPLLLGLRCEQLRAAGPAAAPALLDALNAQLRSAHRRFPAELRRCARSALMHFLKERLIARGLSENTELLSVLEPQDAESFGGFVLAGLPVRTLSAAPAAARRAALEAIGRLSLEELLAAAGGAAHARALALHAAQMLWDYAQQGGGPLGLEKLDRLGSLLWLLPAHDVGRADAASLRMILEAAPPAHTRVCCADATACSAWAGLLLEVFGPPENWTAGSLGAMGGLLATASPSTLNATPSASWTRAADALAAAWPFHRAVALPARAPTLLHACAEGLSHDDAASAEGGARRLAKRVFEAARAQLSDARVQHAPVTHAPRLREAEEVELERDPPRVHVLEADESSEEEEEGKRRKREVGDDLRAAVLEGGASTTAHPHERQTAAPTSAPGMDHARSTTPLQTAAQEDWCGAVTLAGAAAGAALRSEDLLAVDPAHLRACAETLGSLRLAPGAAAAFWARAHEGDTGDDAGEWAADAGRLLAAAPPQQLAALPFKQLDVRAAVAAHLSTEEQRIVAAQALHMAEAAHGGEAEVAATLAAAGAALCALPEADLARHASHGTALVAAAAALGRLPWPGCPRRCLGALARLLTKGDALGGAEKWGAEEAATAGALAAGLPTPWKTLPAGAAAGLTAAAVRCMAPQDFENMNVAQALALHPDAAAAVSDTQLERVRSTLAYSALAAARSDVWPDDYAHAGSSSVPSCAAATVVALLLVAVVAPPGV